MPAKTDVVFEVPASHAPDGASGYTVNAQITVPDAVAGERPVVFVMYPGASFGRIYWDLQPPGHADMSFADHMAAKGIITIAADPLGVGDNISPEDGGQATIETMATASTGVAGVIREQLAAGTLVDGLAPIANAFLVGGGHSLGGITTAIEQANYGTYDAIAPIGVPHLDHDVYAEAYLGDDRSDEALWEGAVKSSAPIVGDAVARGETYITVQKVDAHYEYLLGPEVDRELWAYDSGLSARCPVNVFVETEVSGRISLHTQRVKGPVFIGLGTRETADVGAHKYPAAYSASNDVTLCVVDGAGHCHNYHPDRALLWDRMAAWATSLAAIK